MADDKKAPDEYEYPPEEYYKGGEYIPPDDSDEGLESAQPTRSSFLSKRILLILGILFAVGIVYLILLYINTKKESDLSQPTEATASVPSATDSQTITPPAQAVAPPQVGPSAAEQAALDRAAQQNQLNQQSMANLQNQIQQLQSQVNDITNSITTINNQMQVIANEIKAIATDRSLRGKGLNLVTSGTFYHLKALVPGRAWLQARDGSTTTVTIGDRLPGYGIIQMINTDQGIVTTSSGAVIQYSPKDS